VPAGRNLHGPVIAGGYVGLHGIVGMALGIAAGIVPMMMLRCLRRRWRLNCLARPVEKTRAPFIGAAEWERRRYPSAHYFIPIDGMASGLEFACQGLLPSTCVVQGSPDNARKVAGNAYVPLHE